MEPVPEPPLRNINDNDATDAANDEYITSDQACILLQRNDPKLKVSETLSVCF